MRKLLRRFGLWCLAKAQEDREFFAAYMRAQNADVRAEVLNQALREKERTCDTLLAALVLADGLLSSGQPDQAQSQLRVAIIAHR